MKKLLLILLLPLLFVAVFVVYIYVSAIMEKDKTYYFPQIDTYVKIYKPPFNKNGYVLFSKDSIFSFSENIDFAKIYKSETSSVSFIFNPFEKNKIFVVDWCNNAQINQINFIVEKISRNDTTFFENHIIAGTQTYILKYPYIEVFVEGYLQSVFYTDYSGECPNKVEPI